MHRTLDCSHEERCCVGKLGLHIQLVCSFMQIKNSCKITIEGGCKVAGCVRLQKIDLMMFRVWEIAL